MENRCEANYNVIDPNIPPFKHKDGDAGYDMYTIKSKWIFPFIPRKIPVNFMAEIPEDHYGLMTSRSGEGLKGNFIIPGIIDCIFRGCMSAITVRIGFLPRLIPKGTRIAQLIITPYKEMTWHKTSTLSDTSRGVSSFGESGLK